MDIEVVLTQDDPKLGRRGEVVKVSQGFAHNFLFPHSKAKPATAVNVKPFVDEQNRAHKKEAERVERAKDLIAKIKPLTLTVEAPAGEGQKLFGSVTAQDIQQALAAKGLSLEKKEIVLEKQIHELGEHSVTVKPHSQHQTTLKVKVVKKS